MISAINESMRIRIGDKITIIPRGKRGTWNAEFYHGGQHRHRSLKTANLKIARQRATILEAELAGGDYAAPTKPTGIADAITAFMTAKKAEARAYKTLVKYQDELDAFCDALGEHDIRTLQQITATAFDLYRSARQQGRSPKTVYTGLVIVKTFVKWVVQRELLNKNPLVICKVTVPYSAPKASATLEQVNLILPKATGPRQIQFALLAFSGIRAGELQHLRPQDVDLVGNWIHVRAHGDWQPKTRRARKIPIHPRLAEILKTLVKSTGPYFFCAAPSPKHPKGDNLINLKYLNEDFQNLAKSLGIGVGRKNDGLVIHSLRHFFETQAVDSGIPQFVLDSWMGHVGHSTTGRLYYGLTDEKSQRYMKQVRF
jgi:integrase